MLVHGWKKYNLEDMISNPPIQPRYLPEDKLTIHGQLEIIYTKKIKRILKSPFYPKKPKVYFIVLDLRLTKVGARRCSLVSNIFYSTRKLRFINLYMSVSPSLRQLPEVIDINIGITQITHSVCHQCIRSLQYQFFREMLPESIPACSTP